MSRKNGWQTLTLGDVTENVQYGYTTKGASEGTLKFLRTTDITSGSLNWDTVPFCEVNPKDEEKYLVGENDILISRAGSVGFSYLVTKPERSVFASYLIRFRPKINPKYISYFLKSDQYWSQISEKKLGIAVQNVNATKLKSIAISVAPKEEQEAIVSSIEKLFSELDKANSTILISKKLLHNYQVKILEDAFSTGGLKSRSLGDFITRINAGKSFRCDERPPRENEVGVAKVSAVSWGEYNENESKTCMNPSLINEAYIIKPDDFLISRANTIELVGAAVIVKNTRKRIMLSDKTLRINFSGINPKYVLYFLRTRQGRAQIEAKSTGNQESMRNISQKGIRAIEIPFCELSEQDRIVESIESRMSKIEATAITLKSSNDNSQRLRQSILSKAFKGELL